MNIKNLSSGIVQTIDSADCIDRAIELMETENIHHLPVTDNGSLVGMVSDRDLLLSVGMQTSEERAIGDNEAVVGPTTIDEIMSTPVITISPDATIVEAARQMIEKRISACVLAEDDRVLGILGKITVLTQIVDSPRFSDDLLDALSGCIEEYMTSNVLSLPPDAKIPDAVKMMHDNKIRHIPILDGSEVVGMISDRDVRRAIGTETVNQHKDCPSGPSLVFNDTVADFMSDEVVIIEPDETMQAAAQMMCEHVIGSLPVIDNGQLVGIITDTDVLKVIAGEEAT